MPYGTNRKEYASSHERLSELTHEPAPINLHLYQPPRLLRVNYQDRVGTVFDITGTRENFQGFNHQITNESYLPLTKHGILADRNVSWNLYGVTADWLEVNYPEMIDDLKAQIESGAKPPVGDSYLHIILPFLSRDHKDMLLRISKEVYRQRWGVDPESIWLPESGVDSDTLDSLVANGYKSVHLREHQVYSNRQSNLLDIPTASGNILAVVGQNSLSGKVGFGKPWADAFYEDWFRHSQHLGYSPRISIDGETLGHWWKEGQGVFEFSKYLLHYLQNGRQGKLMDFNNHPIPEGYVAENTSWSCMDAGLGRWKGADNCSCELPRDGHLAHKVRSSKKELYEKLSVASLLIDESLDAALPGWREVYIDWFLRQRISLATGAPISAQFLGDRQLEKLFLSGYIRDLGWTSCGWFFGDVGGFERQIPANSLRAIAEIMEIPDLAPGS